MIDPSMKPYGARLDPGPETAQHLRALREAAYPISGGGTMLIASKDMPFCWIHESGRTLLRRMADVPNDTSFNYLWRTIQPDAADDHQGDEFLARLDVEYPQHGLAIAIIIDAQQDPDLLLAIERGGELAIFVNAPAGGIATLPYLFFSPNINFEFARPNGLESLAAAIRTRRERNARWPR
jgi:hypothetical protein